MHWRNAIVPKNRSVWTRCDYVSLLGPAQRPGTTTLRVARTGLEEAEENLRENFIYFFTFTDFIKCKSSCGSVPGVWPVKPREKNQRCRSQQNKCPGVSTRNSFKCLDFVIYSRCFRQQPLRMQCLDVPNRFHPKTCLKVVNVFPSANIV